METTKLLVIDNDFTSLDSTSNLFAHYFYPVSMVDSAARAIETITTEKIPFDVIVADVDLPDLDAFDLCPKMEKLGVPVILTCAKERFHDLEKKALENGAFVLIPKPVEELAVKLVHQFLMRERVERCKRELAAAANDPMSHVPVTAQAPEGGDDLCCKCRNRKSGGVLSSEVHVEWTDELHQKFMVAVAHLGEGRCFPKEIKEVMNVPGLTTVQVSSHLQKCRNEAWIPPAERQHRSRKTKSSSVSGVTAKGKEKKRRFGSVPQPQPEHISEAMEQPSKLSSTSNS